MTRTSQVAVRSEMLEALTVEAVATNQTCAEEVLDRLLTEWLSVRKDLVEALRVRREKRKQLKSKLDAEIRTAIERGDGKAV